MRKNVKGITLIALVITIIVLLILAGISIAYLTGDHGILTQSKNARVVDIEATQEEKVKLAVQATTLHIQTYIVDNQNFYAGSSDGIEQVAQWLAAELPGNTDSEQGGTTGATANIVNDATKRISNDMYENTPSSNLNDLKDGYRINITEHAGTAGTGSTSSTHSQIVVDWTSGAYRNASNRQSAHMSWTIDVTGNTLALTDGAKVSTAPAKK